MAKFLQLSYASTTNCATFVTGSTFHNMYCKKLVTFVHNIDWDLLKTLIPAWPTQLMMCASNFDLGVINVIVLWEKSDLQPAVKAYMQIYYGGNA